MTPAHGGRIARRRAGALALAGVVAAALGTPAAARATIGPPVVVDGPDAAIGRLGGVAMAPDGTGGVVWRRTVDGQPHVFAARFDGVRWGAPQRIDAGQQYASDWPRIAAADGGRLVAVWTQDGGPGLDGLWSAAIGRGATRFQAPTLVDFTIGEDRAAWPSLAMNEGGDALVVYRAIRRFTGPDLPAGYVDGEIRLARFDGSRWQRLGVPANRNRATPLPEPTALNAPRVAISGNGTGAVAWQEPDDDFIARIWMRRIFGSRTSIALAASALQDQGQLLRAPADEPALAETGLGRLVVAYRQLPDPKARGAAPQLMMNSLDESGTSTAIKPAGPQAVAAAGDAPPALALGDRTDAWLAFPSGGVATLAYAPRSGPFASAGLGAALPAPAPVAIAGVQGRGVVAWASDAGGGEVDAAELDATTADELVPLSADPGGPIRELAAAGSGNGDALVAFAQGTDADRRIVVATVDAAPLAFHLTLAAGWSDARRPLLSWEPAVDALGAVTYTVVIDGRAIAQTTATRVRLAEGVLDQGTHTVRVVATDAAGQHTAAEPASYRLDRLAPIARVTARGHRRLAVRIVDGGGAAASGPASGASSVRWGDGDSTDEATRRASHTYKKPGTYKVTVVAVDAAGNRAVVVRFVRVR
jgi:hypothetical protein